MAFDPNLPDAVKQGLKVRATKPSYFQAALNSPYMMGGDNGAATAVAQGVINNANTAAAAPPAPATPQPTVITNPDPSTVARPAGLRALPNGVVRSDIPGVYLARGKDGSFMASNVTGADGTPDFGGSSKGLRRPGGTSYNPGAAVTGQGGWTNAPGAQGGTYDPNAGVVDTNGAASLPGAATGPRAGYTYAENSLRMNPSQMITAAGINPDAAQAAKEQLIAAMNNDPNSTNPEVAAANRAALAQLQGNVQDVRQQYYGGTGSPLGMVGGLGGGAGAGGRGALTAKDLLGLRLRQGQLAERTARDQATQDYRQHQTTLENQREDRQAAQDLMSRFQQAETATPGSGTNIIEQMLPQGMTQKQAEDFFANDPKGQALQAMLLQEMQHGAQRSLKTPFGIDVEPMDSAHLASNVNFSNMKLDKNGNFAGFYDEGGAAGGSNEYPRHSGFLGADNYDERLLKSISPAYWKALQQVGLRRAQPSPQE